MDLLGKLRANNFFYWNAYVLKIRDQQELNSFYQFLGLGYDSRWNSFFFFFSHNFEKGKPMPDANWGKIMQFVRILYKNCLRDGGIVNDGI